MSCGCNHTPACNPCCTCPPEVSYTLPTCAGGEACEEVSDSQCVGYGNSAASSLNKKPHLPALGVLNGDRLQTILLKLHKLINPMLAVPVPVVNHTATNTATTAPIAPFVVTYLGLGPVVDMTTTASAASTTVTVNSTTGLTAGMTLQVISGTGAFATSTTVQSVTNATTFVISAVPATAFASGAVIRATGSSHQIFTVSVAAGTPKTFAAFVNSPVVVSGTGTIV